MGEKGVGEGRYQWRQGLIRKHESLHSSREVQNILTLHTAPHFYTPTLSHRLLVHQLKHVARGGNPHTPH